MSRRIYVGPLLLCDDGNSLNYGMTGQLVEMGHLKAAFRPDGLTIAYVVSIDSIYSFAVNKTRHAPKP